MQSLLKGVNVFMSVPTGYGMSLVYQMLPFRAERLLQSCSAESNTPVPVVIVISPLVSLMYDQVSKLAANGVNAVCVSGDQENEDAYALVVALPTLGVQRPSLGRESCFWTVTLLDGLLLWQWTKRTAL